MSRTDFDHLSARTLTLRNNVEDVVSITLSPNNETPQRVGRLAYQFHGDYPAEIEIEPGPTVKVGGNIISEIILYGPDEANRKRLTLQITADGAGGLAAVIDSSTTAKSGSVGQESSMPLVFNAGEANGSYVQITADKRLIVSFDGKRVDKTLAEWVK